MQKIFNVSCFICVLFTAYILTWGNYASGENKASVKQELEQKLASILKHPHFNNSSVSLCVVSVKEKEVLFSYKSEKSLKIASNMKLLTTAAALIYLGKDFEYKTCVYSTGKLLSNGVLSGNIILRGSGDPNISGRFYNDKITTIPEMWVDAVEGIGIKTIEGDIVADDTVFDREFFNPTWPKNQHSRWYCAQISGLSFNDNCIDMTIIPGTKEGQLVKVIINPKTNYVNIINTCKTTERKSSHALSLDREPETNDIYLQGKFWKGSKRQTEWVTINNPPLYLATVFKEILEKRNITVKGKTRFVNEQDKNYLKYADKLVCTISTIEQTINIANTRSQNFYAEQILKTLGAYVNKNGTFQSGIDVVKEMITMLGHKPYEYNIADGSGLSSRNRLTTGILTDLLCFMYKHKYGELFTDSLPVSGLSGTLKKRLAEPPYRSRIKAKTGYITAVSSLSGYAETLNGDLLAFSILVNDFDVSNKKIKRLQDAICRTLVDYPGTKSSNN
ncbi:MAG: D-alanyl-D-alanine carboxypeptidase/D-alanyl-D-alanine endopeptidase [Candidatus Anammoxibacter sp.]